jgi:hypothetical protein
MRKLIDEDLRILLNDSSSLDHDYEVKLYKAVYKGLNSPPEVKVADLASDVIKAIEKKLEWQRFLKFYAIAALIIIFGIALLVTGISAVDKNLVLTLVVLLDKYKLICLFTLMSFLGIEVMDKLFSIKQHQS